MVETLSSSINQALSVHSVHYVSAVDEVDIVDVS